VQSSYRVAGAYIARCWKFRLNLGPHAQQTILGDSICVFAVQRYLETCHNPRFKRRVDGLLSQALLANDLAGGQIHGEPWDVPVLASGHPWTSIYSALAVRPRNPVAATLLRLRAT